MRKNFPILLLMVAIILLAAAGPLVAAETPSWQLTLRDDGKIAERVTLPASASLQTDEWKVLSSDGKLVAERTVSNWAAYTKLKDRLPLQISKKNRLIWQDVDIEKTNVPAASNGLAAAVLTNDSSEIVLKVAGFINKNAGTQLDADKVKISAQEINQLGEGKPLVQMTVFNGLMLGISLFVLGFLAVVIVFMNRVRRVNRIIEEEYSLDKAAQLLEEEESGENTTDNKEDE